MVLTGWWFPAGIFFFVKTDQFEVFFLLGLQSHQLQVEVARVRSALPVQSHHRLFRRDLDLDLNDSQFSEQCDVDGSFFNSDAFRGQHHHRCDYFLKPSGSIILRCFWDIQYYNDDYFTIITIIGPMINRSDASPKSSVVCFGHCAFLLN